jgi:hypothetical protein
MIRRELAMALGPFSAGLSGGGGNAEYQSAII